MGRGSKIIALALLATTLGGKAWAECKPNLVGDLPITMAGATPLVHGKIGDKDVSFIIDTGANASLLSAEAVTQLNLKSQTLNGVRAVGIGGEFEVRTVRLEDFVLGGFRVKSSNFLVSPTFSARSGTLGLFGQDFLTQFDLEIDLANGRIRVFDPEGCDKFTMAYWTNAPSVADIIPITRARGHLTAMVSVNDTKVRAMFDTGASTSVLSLEAAARAGVTPNSPGVTAVESLRGLGGSIEAWMAPVASFAVGTESVRNTRLRIGNLQRGVPREMETGSRVRLRDPDQTEMLIGADFFLAHRIYVAYSQRKLYFTYNGGGIFRPITNASTTVAAASVDATASAAAETPTDASGFSRRGAASMTRRDFAGATGDFTRAIELEPEVATHRYDRARAHLADRKPFLASSDLDEALRLKPDDVDALMLRAILLLREDKARAAADFDAAFALAPDNGDLLRQRHNAYLNAGFYQEAIAPLDTWLAKWPSHASRAQVLNNRCWVRAVWGQQLDQALEDCNAALETERQASWLDSRGLVWLKRGDLKRAIEDYDAALKLQPKLAISLYARGVAKTRAGDAGAGKADMVAAVALEPGVEAEAKRYGVTL